MKIIVTGGAGFIGSHIVDAYIKAGHRVAVIDNLSTGFKRNLNPKAKFYNADIRNGEAMKKIVERERPDITSHHAALVSVVESVKNPAATIATNVLGTLNMLLAWENQRSKKKKFIFASTGGAIYGEPKTIPAKETAEVNPLAMYGLSKLTAEKTIKMYAGRFGFRYLMLRYANVYGARQNPNGEAGVVAIFSNAMRRNKRPTIFGDGTKTRDYLHIDDVVQANLLGLRRGENETVNLGWGKPVSDQQMFDAIAGELEFVRKPVYAPYRKDEVFHITLDAARARTSLGWRPRIKLKEGIRKTASAI